MLASKGHIYPATINDVRLVAELEDGTVVRGETQITASHSAIKSLRLEPEQCLPLPEALAAIRTADVITVGPGSLYTSILPNLLVARVAQAIGDAQATKIFICNLMTQPGETDGYSARQHLDVVKKYAPEIHFDFVVVNDRPVSEELRRRYAAEGANQIGLEADAIDKVVNGDTEVVRADLLAEGEKARHDSEALASVVICLPATSCLTAGCFRITEKESRLIPLEQHRPLDVLILAAGLGTRMKSQRAKVLHELGGHPLIAHVIRKAHALDHQKIYVVVGHQAAEVEAAVRREFGTDAGTADFILQRQQRGTGDAVKSAGEALKDSNSTLLVLSGDVPLIRVETLQKFVDFHHANGAACSILSVKLENPTGYGRMVRDATEGFARIVEHKDATAEERLIREINSGIYCFETTKLFSALNEIEPANQQGEYYLTDVPAILAAGGERVAIYLHQDAREVSGINTRADLAEFENLLRRGTIRSLMMEGVTFIDPSHAYISAEAKIGPDCVIYPTC